jgi:alpha-tubulin suppressor-like RCC1 family protein
MGRLHGRAETCWSGVVGSRRARRWRVSLAVLAVGVGALGLSGCVADPPPIIGNATPGNGSAVVSWQAPANAMLATYPITGYVVTPWIGFDRQTPVVFNSTATTQTVTGLTNGVTYTFTVHAINSLGGDSASSGMSNRVTPGAGALYAWGSNYVGQLGIGSASFRPMPAQIGTDPWAAIANGEFHAVAIKTDGTLWAWGHNNVGQLGDGTTTDRTTPVQIGTDTDWASVDAGVQHTLARKTNGTVWAWGANGNGQLGDGTTTAHTTPTQVGIDTDWAAVAAGSFHALAVKTDGTLWAWGYNIKGAVGDGTTTDRLTPIQIGIDTDWVFVSGGGFHTQAIKTNGTLWAWGWNLSGELGDGTTTQRNAPVQIGTDTDWASVSAGAGIYTEATKTSGTLWAWGFNGSGRLGDGTTTNRRTSPVQIGTDTNWTSVTAGDDHTAATKSDGSLWAWGNNQAGQFGDGTITAGRNSPAQVGTDNNWSSVRAGKHFTTALKTDGSLWAWGDDQYGELGDAPVASLAAPTQVGTDTDWITADGGSYHTAAIKADGSLWAWGYNSNGEVGDGTSVGVRATPVRVGADTDWASVSAGGYFTTALKTDHSLWAWGNNGDGRLGDGTTTGRNSPAQVGTSTDWSTVSAGANHVLAVKTDGTLWAWGNNDCGQVGDGTQTHRTTPVQIGTDTNWRSVSAGPSGSIGLRTNGTVWRWGSICPETEGDPTLTPTQFTFGTNWQSVSMSVGAGYWMIGTRTNGTLWVGQILDGLVFSASRIGTDFDWASIADGGGDLYGATAEMTKTNGTLWTLTSSTNTPTQVGTATNWVTVGSGGSHALAIATP